MSICVKAIGGRIPVSELVFARAAISLIMTRLLLLKNNIATTILRIFWNRRACGKNK